MPTPRSIAFSLGLLSILACIACTSAPGAKPSRAGSSAEEACFDADLVRSFSPLNQRFVYVQARSDEHYLLTLDNIYPGLRYATGMTISAGSFSRVCSGSGAVVTFVDSGVTVRSGIVRVEAVASKDAAQTLADERTSTKPKR